VLTKERKSKLIRRKGQNYLYRQSGSACKCKSLFPTAKPMSQRGVSLVRRLFLNPIKDNYEVLSIYPITTFSKPPPNFFITIICVNASSKTISVLCRNSHEILCWLCRKALHKS